MRTSNPYLKEKSFREAAATVSTTEGRMTVNGTLNKISLLLVVVAACASFSWNWVQSSPTGLGNAQPWMIGGILGALGISLVISFKPHLAPVLAVPFAILEGATLGIISALYSVAAYPGIVFQAVMLTLGVSLSMFLVWRSGLVKVTDKMRSIVVGAMGAIFLVYLLSFVLGFMGIQIPMIHGSGPIGIGFSLLVIAVVSFMLMVDFDMIQRMSQQGAPKSMEWFGAFALLVTLVWLYLEMLRLLSKLNSRD